MTEGDAPEYGGKCALGVGLLGTEKAPAGNPKHSLVKDGKTYYFTSTPAKLLFEHVPGLAGRAEKKAAA